MGRFDDDAFGGLWDLGELLNPDLISYPIKQMIKRDAVRAGIDVSNPIRSVVDLLGSAFMSATLGAFMGPFGALLGGLFAYTAVMGTPMIGDREADDVDVEEEARYALKLKAFALAVEATKDHASRDTWNRISDAMQDAVKAAHEAQTLKDAYYVIYPATCDTIRSVDSDVYDGFREVLSAAEEELDV